jgi:DNA-binding CsgD family transcriptional regulator
MARFEIGAKRVVKDGPYTPGALGKELSLKQVLKWPVDGLTLRVAGGDGRVAASGGGDQAHYEEQLETIIDLLHTLLAVLEPQMPEAGRRGVAVGARPEAYDVGEIYGLTPREEEVLVEMIDGKSNRQIAATLTVSVSTIKSHVSNILAKMGAESRTEAAALALQQQNEIDCGRLFCGDTRPDCLRQPGRSGWNL